MCWDSALVMPGIISSCDFRHLCIIKMKVQTLLWTIFEDDVFCQLLQYSVNWVQHLRWPLEKLLHVHIFRLLFNLLNTFMGLAIMNVFVFTGPPDFLFVFFKKCDHVVWCEYGNVSGIGKKLYMAQTVVPFPYITGSYCGFCCHNAIKWPNKQIKRLIIFLYIYLFILVPTPTECFCDSLS